MKKVNNKKAITRLAVRSFQANRTRNFIAAAAIALTAVLFTTLFTLGLGAADNLQRSTMRQAGSGGHAALKYQTQEQYDTVKKHSSIENISYNRILADSVENPELLKRRGEFYYIDEPGQELAFCVPTTGAAPQAENELMTDTKTLQLLGVPLKLGAPVTLELTVHGQNVRRDFVLSGWWEADPVFNVAMLVTSRAYMDAHREELSYTYTSDASMTGVINSYVMFQNALNLDAKLNRLLTESGYQTTDKEAPNYIAANTNWAYLSAGSALSPTMLLGMLGAALLIVLTGYLIIYNVFQISVVKDIRFYGLLKTVGTTGKQLKAIIRRQALMLSVIGIPIGLMLGFLLGKVLVPVLLSSTYQGMGVGNVQVEANPLIFASSALFALVTVFISTRKPGRLAAAVSPVEAVRYTEADIARTKKEKKTTDGGRIPKMALSNLARNRRRTILTVLSLALSLVLLNSVFTLSGSFDMDNYLSRFVDTDFLIAQAEYFNYQFRGPENELSQSMMEAVKARPGFQEGGKLLANNSDAEHFAVEAPKNAAQLPPGSDVDQDGNIACAVYGLETLPLSHLEVVEGQLDLEKLATGNYIIEGLDCDDYGQPYSYSSHYEIGDTVTLHNHKGSGERTDENKPETRSFTLLAKVKVAYFTASDGHSWDYTFYLPAEVYTGMVADPGLMSYAFNVANGEEQAMDAFLKNYTGQTEPTMHYASKATRAEEFRGMQTTILLIGGALSIIIGFIGLLNFANSILTSIVTRRREFAILESVGMTGQQLRRLLTLEGLYYALFTSAGALALSILVSQFVVRSVVSGVWFFSFRFVLWPVLLTIPFLLALSAVIPRLALRYSGSRSVVERLREGES